MKKKGQGISINTIIIAAIALIVLVVLVAVFTGRINVFGDKVAKVGQECADYAEELADGETKDAEWKASCEDGEREIFGVIDADQNPSLRCCKDI